LHDYVSVLQLSCDSQDRQPLDLRAQLSDSESRCKEIDEKLRKSIEAHEATRCDMSNAKGMLNLSHGQLGAAIDRLQALKDGNGRLVAEGCSIQQLHKEELKRMTLERDKVSSGFNYKIRSLEEMVIDRNKKLEDLSVTYRECH
jgi:hypothetical protein